MYCFCLSQKLQKQIEEDVKIKNKQILEENLELMKSQKLNFYNDSQNFVKNDDTILKAKDDEIKKYMGIVEFLHAQLDQEKKKNWSLENKIKTLELEALNRNTAEITETANCQQSLTQSSFLNFDSGKHSWFYVKKTC